MRYPKGSIHLSPAHDLPILRQMLRCGFVTHEQLWAFLHGDGTEWCRRSFNRRLVRLAEHGFLVRHTVPGLAVFGVYAVTPLGADHLAEECFTGAATVTSHGRAATCLRHEIDVNDIHLALRRSGCVAHWTYATEIRALNELSGSGHVKDYDAVVRLRTARGETTVALEYERTPKARARYEAIARLLDREAQADAVLYVAAHHALLRFVLPLVGATRLPVWGAVRADVLRHGVGAEALSASHLLPAPLSRALSDLR